jgi:hypothetical protein
VKDAMNLNKCWMHKRKKKRKERKKDPKQSKRQKEQRSTWECVSLRNNPYSATASQH